MGIVLYQLLAGRHPFGEYKHYNIDKHLNGEIDFQHPVGFSVDDYNPFFHVSENAKNLICKMVCKDVSQRPTVDEVLNHPWFEEFGVNLKPAMTSNTEQRINMNARFVFGNEIATS